MVNSNQNKIPVPSMPFGLCLVSSSLETAGHEVHFLDLCFSKKTTRDIDNAVKKFQPDVIGVSVRNIDTVSWLDTLFHLNSVKENVIIPLKNVFSGPIVIGGTAVGIIAAEMLGFFDLEYAIRGDGEAAIVEFVNRLEKKESLKGLGGLTWRKNGKIIEENPPLWVKDLDSLTLSNPHQYLELKAYKKFKAPIQVQTKRGCALKCTYCAYNVIEGDNYRLRDPKLVADEIEKLQKETGSNHFEFSDSTFNIPLDHSKSVLKSIIDKKLNNLNLRTMGLNPGTIDEEFADLMKKAGFKDVEVGVEAGCNKMLKVLGKNFTKDDIFKTARILRKINMPTMWYLLTGAPGETKETLKETFEAINKAVSKWDLVVVLNGIRVNKGTLLAKQFLEENPHGTDDNFLHPVFYEPKGLRLEELRVFNKRIGLKYSNYIFPEEYQRLPTFALRIQTAIMRTFAPNTPWWKFNILMRKIQKITGINTMKRLLYWFKDRNLSRKYN